MFESPCGCRCRHCLLESGQRLSGVSFDRTMALAERFVRWREDNGLPNFPIEIGFGYACDVTPRFLRTLEFSRELGATGKHVPVKGRAFMDEDTLRQDLLTLKAHGVENIGLTFYGLPEFHDRWAGRRGDFEHTMLAARLTAECGLNRYDTVFASRQSAADLPELLERLDGVPGCGERIVCAWDYRGRGKRLEDERLTTEEVAALPAHVREQMDSAYKPESDWVKAVLVGDYPRKSRRYYMLTLWDENIEGLEATDPGDILRGMRERDDRMYQSIPAMPALAELYGNESGNRLYTLRDLEWKWIDCYLRDHPEINPTAAFDDLGSTILWK